MNHLICTTSKLSDFLKYVCCDIVDFQVWAVIKKEMDFT